ncbi:histone deacetylase domain-containing protein [Aspergillus egyptiacus]|nr:histone deacetylase domain-containing protein [Aspergillus egyptiacus]
MDPSKPLAATSSRTPSKAHPHPPPPIDPSIFADRVSYPSLATPSPASPSGFGPSLLSPSGPSACSGGSQAPHPTPRRIASASSLRDERRMSTPGLKKRSSTASLRSTQLNTRDSTSPRASMSRRSSSAFATSPTAATLTPSGYIMSPKRPSLSATQEQPVPTAASIAADHFRKEIDHHQSSDLQSQTLVVIHDACYGHRFSRPRTSRAALSSIVERPERVQACVVGISAAYVRLAHRYTGGQFAPQPDLNLAQLPVPPFQIRKTGRTLAVNSPAVTHVHGNKWMEDLKSMCDAAESRLALNGKELVRPRSAGRDSTSRASSDTPFHEGDLYLCSESLNAFEGALGGVCEGIDAVFSANPTKRAFVCIRPPGHHCSAGHPSGFCWINNVHVGISYAAMTHGLTHAAILDFDLHHGDGSQDITWAQNAKATAAPWNSAAHKKTMIGYFSLHDINSYPCEQGDPEKVRNASVCIEKAHGQSIWNVHLEPWKTEQEFWEIYSAKYTVLIDRARAFLKMHTDRLAGVPNSPPPRAAVFISAGFDASEWEGAGMQRHQVNVPTEFYARFTADVVRMAEEEGLGVDGRVVSVLEGGYSNRALTTGVLSHLSGLGDTRQSQGSLCDYQVNRLATEMTDRLGLTDTIPTEKPRKVYDASYDREWWSPPLLEDLEALLYPPPPPSKPKGKSAPTYSAPTQSFAAKAVLPTRDRKSTGSHASLELESPPLPPVSWAVAAHELSKILIPSDRQTTSCRPEELNAEASRLRRERQTAVADTAKHGSVRPATESTAANENKMRLRIRKPKIPLSSTARAEELARPANRNNRRTTLDSPSALPEPPKSPGPRGTRRKSAATTQSAVKPSTQEENGSDQRRRPTSRSGTPKYTSSPQEALPVSRVPSALHTAPVDEATRPHTSKGGTESMQNDVDSLTADVRKLSIKLKVPSPEENAARERKAAEECKLPSNGSRPTKKAPAGKASTPSSNADAASQVSAPSSSRDDSSIPSTFPVSEEHSQRTQQHQSLSLITPDASSPTPMIEARGTEPDSFDQNASLGGSNPASSTSPYAGVTPPLTPGVSDSASPKSMLFSPPASISVKRQGFPVVTSNVPIPFAPSSANNNNDANPSDFGTH